MNVDPETKKNPKEKVCLKMQGMGIKTVEIICVKFVLYLSGNIIIIKS